jgi:hypothetical protein
MERYGQSLGRLIRGGGTRLEMAFTPPPNAGEDGEDRDTRVWPARVEQTDDFVHTTCDLVLTVARPRRQDPSWRNARTQPIVAYDD